jgi:cytochrome P450 family 3 subfamily A
METIAISCKFYCDLFINFNKVFILSFQKISPTFSSGKMRRMYPLIEECAKSLEKVLTNAAINKQEVDMKKVMGNLTMDVIATCAFATKIDTHNDPNNPFVKNAKKIFAANLRFLINFIILATFPSLLKKLGISFFNSSAQEFFTTAVRNL